MGHTAGLKFRETGFITHNRQLTIEQPIKHAVQLYELQLSLLNKFIPFKKKNTSDWCFLLVIKQRSKKSAAWSFFEHENLNEIDVVKDQINKRYGHSTIKGAEGL